MSYHKMVLVCFYTSSACLLYTISEDEYLIFTSEQVTVDL